MTVGRARGLGRTALVAAAALLGLAAPSAAQGDERWRRIDLELGPSYTNTAIYGTAYRQAGDDYDNAFSLYSDGFGLNAIGHWVFRESSVWSRTEISFGPFVAFERTVFRGRTLTNAAVHADYGDMWVDRFVTGLHVRVRFGSPTAGVRFFLGFQLGGGASLIHDTHLRIDASPSGGPTFGGALYDRTLTGTFGGAARLGWTFDVADAVGVTCYAFLGYWKNGRPDDVKNDPWIAPADPGAFSGYAVGLGIAIELRMGFAPGTASAPAAAPRRPRIG